jgi:tetratricopeptide (TPR) repeat protein
MTPMTKKSSPKDKEVSPKSNKKQPDKHPYKGILQMQRPATGKTSQAVDPAFTQAVQNYESGLKLLQERKFDRAKSALEKVLAGPVKELADRARVHLNTCNQQLSKPTTSFKSLEEHFDYAISLMNLADYEGARSHMERIVRQSPEADFAFYGLALLDSLTNRAEDCLRNLDQAIRLNPANRFQARNDSDFQNMADDPRFTELLYPEVSDSTAHSSR